MSRVAAVLLAFLVRASSETSSTTVTDRPKVKAFRNLSQMPLPPNFTPYEGYVGTYTAPTAATGDSSPEDETEASADKLIGRALQAVPDRTELDATPIAKSSAVHLAAPPLPPPTLRYAKIADVRPLQQSPLGVAPPTRVALDPKLVAPLEYKLPGGALNVFVSLPFEAQAAELPKGGANPYGDDVFNSLSLEDSYKSVNKQPDPAAPAPAANTEAESAKNMELQKKKEADAAAAEQKRQERAAAEQKRQEARAEEQKKLQAEREERQKKAAEEREERQRKAAEAAQNAEKAKAEAAAEKAKAEAAPAPAPAPAPPPAPRPPVVAPAPLPAPPVFSPAPSPLPSYVKPDGDSLVMRPAPSGITAYSVPAPAVKPKITPDQITFGAKPAPAPAQQARTSYELARKKQQEKKVAPGDLKGSLLGPFGNVLGVAGAGAGVYGYVVKQQAGEPVEVNFDDLPLPKPGQSWGRRRGGNPYPKPDWPWWETQVEPVGQQLYNTLDELFESRWPKPVKPAATKLEEPLPAPAPAPEPLPPPPPEMAVVEEKVEVPPAPAPAPAPLPAAAPAAARRSLPGTPQPTPAPVPVARRTLPGTPQPTPAPELLAQTPRTDLLATSAQALAGLLIGFGATSLVLRFTSRRSEVMPCSH